MTPLRIAMVSSPWIRVPPSGYGGVESMVGCLTRELVAAGHHVELFSIDGSDVPGVPTHSLFDRENYDDISRPLYDVAAIPAAHLLMARRVISEINRFDIVHDHNYILGPMVFSGVAPVFPPVLHTLHGPFLQPSPHGPPSNLSVYGELAHAPRLWFNGVSRAQLRSAPSELFPRVLGVVHHGVDLAYYLFHARPREGFVSLARFAPEKGHHIAARLCRDRRLRLRMAGAVGAVSTADDVAVALADRASPHWSNRELRHFDEDVLPHLEPGLVTYEGEARGAAKLRLLGRSRALLLPIDWEEPFGIAAIEALACGTPVVAYARGALPEIVEHGVTGFLAYNEDEFADYLDEVDQLDHRACRAAVEARFSSPAMARGYVRLYEQALDHQNDLGQANDARFSYPAAEDR